MGDGIIQPDRQVPFRHAGRPEEVNQRVYQRRQNRGSQRVTQKPEHRRAVALPHHCADQYRQQGEFQWCEGAVRIPQGQGDP